MITITDLWRFVRDLAFLALLAYLALNHWPMVATKIDHVHDQITAPESTIDADLIWIENQ